MLKFIGIDLGQKGAIAVQSKLPFTKTTLEIFPFWQRFGGTRLRTATEQELLEFIKTSASGAGEVYVTVEHPVYVPSNGKKAIGVLHQNFGFVLGALGALGLDSLWLPKPVQWKKTTGFKGKDKGQMLQFAQRLFKNSSITELTADAVLISEACRLHFKDM